tara:strand:- start:735 stop:1004 length:270 start_codon:yes stop_codon:yes gene_type:complete
MSQYDTQVEEQRARIAAEEWAGKVRSLHAHSLSSMYYDNRPQDTADGKCVLDVEYNDGTVRRELSDGGVVIFGKPLTGDELLNSHRRNT